MESTLESYQKVYQMLEDEQSRFIYLNRINYLITKNSQFIKNIIPEKLPRTDTQGNFPFLDDTLSQIPAEAEIVLYGAGVYPKKYINLWNGDQRIIGFCSNNRQKQKDGYLGYPVMSPEELLSQNEYYVVVSVSMPTPRKEILDYLAKSGYPQEKIFSVSSMIEDEYQYFPEDIIQFGNNEVFVDAGCYDLGNSLVFKQLCPNLKKIYAFEPDPESYQRCQKRKAETGFQEIEILPVGTWSHSDTLSFHADGSESSGVVAGEADFQVKVMPIDALVANCDETPKITFIKMDVEGAELESLMGAKGVIQRDKPKLAICVYHKPEDLVTIPLYIKELVPQYKLYLRHHTNFIGDTVLYAVYK